MGVSPSSPVLAERIENRIFLLRGEKVLFDFHLAELYGVETKTLNRAVQRNSERFPADFMFQLTRDDLANLIFQSGTSSSWGGIRKSPFAFTEHGAVMAANILRSERAIEASVAVVRAFIRMRGILLEYRELAKRLDELESKFSGHDKALKTVIETIRQLMPVTIAKPKRITGFSS